MENSEPAVVLCASTLLLILSRYLPFGGEIFYLPFYLVILPAIVILIVLRKNPLDYGLRIGDIRISSAHVLAACLISLLLVLIASRIPAFREYYGRTELKSLSFLADRAVALFSAEFMFRGFILFGLRKRFGEGAVLIQMVPFAMLHAGKPSLETAGCVVSGIYFGYLTLRTGSLWPAFIIHCFINLLIRVTVLC